MSQLLDNFDLQLFLSLKLLLIPVILLCIVLVEKKLGTVLGGALSGLPLVSGTLLSFAVFHQSYEDYSHSIYGALAGVVSLSVMIFAYSKMTYSITGGSKTTLNAKERWTIFFKSLAIYLVISAIFAGAQKHLNTMIESNTFIPFLLMGFCAVLNFILYKNLPKIRPDENTINFKFKNIFYMALIGTLTFSFFSSIKVYGSYSGLIGLISTAPFYLSFVVCLTHKFGTDYDVLHLNKGILVGFFGYILFFGTFLIGLTILHLEPKIIVPTAIVITIFSFLVYALIFRKNNKAEITKLSIQSLSSLIPIEDQFNNSLQQQLLANKEDGVEIKSLDITQAITPNVLPTDEIKA